LPYRITYSAEARGHLRGLTARQRRIVLDTVDEQLLHQPRVRTRNRKPMEENPLAEWELRIGDLRVYYQVIEEPEPEVQIRAVGIKIRNRVYIGGEEADL
jgi:mRNA-degrading endonuclease RelE of RelBE toxin-antitoxin system